MSPADGGGGWAPKGDPFIEEPTEYALVGSVLCDSAYLLALEDLLPEHFASAKAGTTWWAIQQVHARGYDVNTLSVFDHLRDHGRLADVGGNEPSCMEQLQFFENKSVFAGPSLGFTEKGVVQLGARVKDLAMRRRLRAFARDIENQAKDFRTTTAEVAMKAAERMLTLSAENTSVIQTAAYYADKSIERIEATQKNPARAKLVRTGIAVIDRHLGGVPRKRVTVILAPPSVGKSGLMDTMAQSIAEGDESVGREPQGVYFGQLEDEAEAYTDRHLAEHSGLSLREMASAGLSREQLEALTRAGEATHAANERIFIDPRRGLTIKPFLATARHYCRKHGIRVVMVDHALQLMTDAAKIGEEIFRITKELSDFAHLEDVAIVLALHTTDPGPGVKKTEDMRYLKPTLQMLAGGTMVARYARLILGMRLLPPKPDPKPRAKQEQPKRATEEELLAWQHRQAEEEAKYQRELRAVRESNELRKKRVGLSVVKQNEGTQDFEIWLERIGHAGLFDRKKGDTMDGDPGYTPGPASRAA